MKVALGKDRTSN